MVMMDTAKVRSLSGGVNQSGLRHFNERLILSIIQRYGETPGSEIARLTGLSPQTVSVIIRKLENDGLVMRGDPVKGKVGKPSTPMALAPDGAFSIGLKIGRRTASLLLMDLLGTVRKQVQLAYRYPTPAKIFPFLDAGLTEVSAGLSEAERQRIVGIGIAAPHELWNWHELVSAPAEEVGQWQCVDFRAEVAKFSALPVSIVNDATAACRAEHIFGRGREYRDFAYFFVGAFVGGGVVINHSVHEGSQGNAGAFGTLRSTGPDGKDRALIDTASIFVLEERLERAGLDPRRLWAEPQDWDGIGEHLDPWIAQVGRELAKAAVSVCAVIDFEAILIDGAFPEGVRQAIVDQAKICIETLDTRGVIKPAIESGTVGAAARSIGAACGPIFDSFFLNRNAGLSAA